MRAQRPLKMLCVFLFCCRSNKDAEATVSRRELAAATSLLPERVQGLLEPIAVKKNGDDDHWQLKVPRCEHAPTCAHQLTRPRRDRDWESRNSELSQAFLQFWTQNDGRITTNLNSSKYGEGTEEEEKLVRCARPHAHTQARHARRARADRTGRERLQRSAAARADAFARRRCACATLLFCFCFFFCLFVCSA